MVAIASVLIDLDTTAMAPLNDEARREIPAGRASSEAMVADEPFTYSPLSGSYTTHSHLPHAIFCNPNVGLLAILNGGMAVCGGTHVDVCVYRKSIFSSNRFFFFSHQRGW